MSDYQKYLKYKKKYLKLVEEQKKNKHITSYKISFGGSKNDNDIRIVKTVDNNMGSRDGMTNQCFWISVLQYLQKNGYPDLTLRELRRQARLDKRTEHEMFDTDYLIKKNNGKIPIFFNAANRIASRYGLRIQIYSVNHNGEVIQPRGIIGNGENLVEIAQFGLTHFELIDDTDGESFIPAIPIKGNLTKNNSNKIIEPEKEQVYIQLNENLGMIQIYNDYLRELAISYDTQSTNIDNILESNEFTSEEKKRFVSFYKDSLSNTTSQINTVEENLRNLGNENLSLSLLVEEYEK